MGERSATHPFFRDAQRKAELLCFLGWEAMSKLQNYRGYAAAIQFHAEDELFTGRIAGISDMIGFHADTIPGIKAAFQEAVDDYLAVCAQTGKPPENFSPAK